VVHRLTTPTLVRRVRGLAGDDRPTSHHEDRAEKDRRDHREHDAQRREARHDPARDARDEKDGRQEGATTRCGTAARDGGGVRRT